MAESAVGGRRGIRPRKENRPRFRPYSLFFNGNGAEIIADDVSTKPRGNLRIGFKRYDAAIFSDNSRGKKREETNVYANIVKYHSGTQLALQNDLPFALSPPLHVISTRAP